MAAASDSNDASDIFWPGYVDAVTNLAINLLFVIAVMSIVVLTNVLQIAKLKPEGFVPKTVETKSTNQSTTDTSTPGFEKQTALVQSAQQVQQALEQVKRTISSTSTTSGKTSATDPFDAATEQALKVLVDTLEQNSKELAPGKLEKLFADKVAAEKLSAEQGQELKKLQKELQNLKTGQASQKSLQGNAEDVGGTGNTAGRSNEVRASQNKQMAKTGPSQFEGLNAGGLVVIFDKDVVELSDKEATELIEKMGLTPQNAEGPWLLQVISPKGFSEATRLAYYRVNTIRNVLLKNGVTSSAIDMRVVESESTGANNARVLVRLIKP